VKTVYKSELQKSRVFSYLRWSSAPQTWGDSERRQNQAALNWCRQRGLSLMQEDKFVDAGVSAKAGANQKLELGRLLTEVKPNDYLLIEDADRLTRQDWLSAMKLVEGVLARGVTLVTLQNGNEITEQTFRHDPGVFLPLLLRSHLANDENDKKAKRIKSSWERRLAAVKQGKPLNANLARWLCWVPEPGAPQGSGRGKVEVIEEKAEVVRQMFRLYLQGKSISTVARTLNQAGAPRVSRKTRFNGKSVSGHSTDLVYRTLNNKVAIGYCKGQPGLYPAIVSEEDFYKVQAQLEAGRHLTVRTKTAADNLFLGLAVCAKCGAPMHKHSQQQREKVYPYLCCGNSLRKGGTCGFGSFRYDVLEQSFLALLATGDLVRQTLSAKASTQQPSKLDSIKAKVEVEETSIIKYMELIRHDPKPSPTLYNELKTAEAKAESLRSEQQREESRLKTESPALETYQ